MGEHDLRWLQTACSRFASGGGGALALNRQTLDVVEVAPLAAAVLSRCRGARSLTDHAASAWSAGVSDAPAAVAEAIDSLIARGLLRRLPVMPTAGATASVPIDTVAIVSADRPAAVGRALHSLARERTTPLQVLVIDGSRQHAADTRAVVDKSADLPGLRSAYVGLTEAATVRSRVATSCNVPANLLSAALTPGDIGAGRNLALLLAAGRRLLMLDDDVVTEVWADADSCAHDVVLAGHSDLRTWRFGETRDAVFASLRNTGADIAAVHGATLGRSLAAIAHAGDGVIFDHACAHILAALDDAAARRIAVTFAGAAGDSGRYCSHGLLFQPGPLRHLLWTNQAAFTTATTSREVAVVAPQTIVTHDPACLAYCMGVDARTLLPPFMPVGRNEDGVWGATLSLTDPSALFAHVPWGIRHESHRPATYGQPMASARETRISDLLLSLIARSAPLAFATAPPDRLRWLGRLLIDVGRLSPHDFRVLVAEAKLASMSTTLSRADAAAADPACPAYWRDALSEYRRVFTESVGRTAYFAPTEFAREATAGFREAQRFVGTFGELLTWWPSVWEAARSLNVDGRAPLCNYMGASK